MRKPKYQVHTPRPGIYTCSHCRNKRDWTDFHRDRTRYNGLHSRCKDCVAVINANRHRHKVKSGECTNCPNRAAPGYVHCHSCREKTRR